MTKPVALVAALAMLAALGACTSEADGSRYASCIDLGAVEERAVPEPLAVPEGARVTELVEQEGYVVLSAVAEGGVDDVYGPMEEELKAGGFEIVGRDYEGFEAELFFVSERDGAGEDGGDSSAGVVRVRLGPCPEQVTLSILYDPIETGAGRAAIERARQRAARRSTPN